MNGTSASLFECVVDVLAPYLGKTASRASVAMFLRRFGIEPEALDPEHLPDLAGKLEPGLRVFVGGTTAKMLSRRVLMLSERNGEI